MSAEQLAIKNVGKLDPKRHLEEKVIVFSSFFTTLPVSIIKIQFVNLYFFVRQVMIGDGTINILDLKMVEVKLY